MQTLASKNFIDPRHFNDIEHLYSEPLYADSKKNKKGRSKRKKKNDKQNSDSLEKDNWKFFGKKKQKKPGFNFLKFHSKQKWESKDDGTASSPFLDARDCNSGGEAEMVSSFQSMCQKHYKAAKNVSKNIYNKIIHHYDYTHSFATVVYSDRYFLYNFTLETKTMPTKCFISNDLSGELLHKRFTRNCNNYTNMLNLESKWCSVNATNTKHYMPIFTSWGIQPYSPYSSVLFDFTDRYLLHYADRRHYYSTFFDDIQQFYDLNRQLFPNYRPLVDVFACSRELLDYDDFIYSHFRLGETNQKQMQPLFFHERRPFTYRNSAKGFTPLLRFTDYEMNSKKKAFKKNNPCGQPSTYGYTTFVSKFPVPDFALSEDDLLTRWTNALYEKTKSYEPTKIYEKLYKPSRRLSNSNLDLVEPDLLDKRNNKTYSLDKKKINFDQSLKDSDNDIKECKNNLGVSSLLESNKELNKASLARMGGIGDILTASSSERGNLLVMEPLLILQNINQERIKHKLMAAKKAQRLMVYVIIGYTIFFITFSLVAFYVMYFT